MTILQPDRFRRTRPVYLSCITMLGLISCVQADSPEQFVPYTDPGLQNDYISGLPSTGSSNGFEYEIVQGIAIFEGDIILGEVDSQGRVFTKLAARGVGLNNAFSRWPDGIVVYEAPTSNSQLQQERVALAIAHWMENTTLTFVERTEENADQYSSYLQFISSLSCASHVGKIGGPQPVYISDNCTVGSVIHEIGHTVGLFHEHTRVDRDSYITIDWDEIVEDKGLNFNLQTANTDTYSEYDYGSIMHYGETFFSRSGQPTIIVADGIEIGQRDALSPLDIESVNKMYETDLALGPPASSVTQDGLEVDVTIYNQGIRGAHQLELLLRLDENTRWTHVSENSGWDCTTMDYQLMCKRDTMREQTESRFTVIADTTSTTTNDLSVRLSSRTQDSDLENNTLNDDGIDWLSLDPDAEPESTPSFEPLAETEEPETTTVSDSDPVLQAAVQRQASNQDSVIVTESSAGFAGTPSLALLASLLAIRRRRYNA